MGTKTWVTVHCDVEGCPNWDADGGGGYFTAEARRRARMVGWVWHGRRDYCPDCAKEMSLV